MDNLVIGDTSQLSSYFPENYIKISSRNIDINFLKKKQWGSVYLCFGESRKHLYDIKLYDEINYKLTKELIEILNNNSNKIVVYSTCELWSKYSGSIDISQQPNFYPTPYLNSKYEITKFILGNKDLKNTLIMYPFNFNSTKRDSNFLFGKIFDSIINKRKITIGNTYFYRDIIHPIFVVNESINADKHKIIGSGRLTFVNDFIRELYSIRGLSFDDYVIEKLDHFVEYDKINEYYLKTNKCVYSYTDLISDTIKDIETCIGTN
jgi:nucleoside-diphosphate-sugar epimerase